MNWRLVDSDLSEPAFTAAADEAMAIARAQGTVPNTLHLYRRSRPTVSLGYFQKVHESVDLDFCRSNEISIVRRVTGGSAIYTDSGHLIYGFSVDEDALPRDRKESMRLVCSAVMLALEELGVQPNFKSPNDILVGGRKISGSAQMRRMGIVLQHGTLVLRHRPEMMAGALRMDIGKISSRGLVPSDYVTSLAVVMGTEPDIPKVKSALAHGFEKTFGVRFACSGFSAWEQDEIQRLTETKYGLDEWNMKR